MTAVGNPHLTVGQGTACTVCYQSQDGIQCKGKVQVWNGAATAQHHSNQAVLFM